MNTSKQSQFEEFIVSESEEEQEQQQDSENENDKDSHFQKMKQAYEKKNYLKKLNKDIQFPQIQTEANLAYIGYIFEKDNEQIMPESILFNKQSKILMEQIKKYKNKNIEEDTNQWKNAIKNHSFNEFKKKQQYLPFVAKRNVKYYRVPTSSEEKERILKLKQQQQEQSNLQQQEEEEQKEQEKNNLENTLNQKENQYLLNINIQNTQVSKNSSQSHQKNENFILKSKSPDQQGDNLEIQNNLHYQHQTEQIIMQNKQQDQKISKKYFQSQEINNNSKINSQEINFINNQIDTNNIEENKQKKQQLYFNNGENEQKSQISNLSIYNQYKMPKINERYKHIRTSSCDIAYLKDKIQKPFNNYSQFDMEISQIEEMDEDQLREIDIQDLQKLFNHFLNNMESNKNNRSQFSKQAKLEMKIFLKMYKRLVENHIIGIQRRLMLSKQQGEKKKLQFQLKASENKLENLKEIEKQQNTVEEINEDLIKNNQFINKQKSKFDNKCDNLEFFYKIMKDHDFPEQNITRIILKMKQVEYTDNLETQKNIMKEYKDSINDKNNPSNSLFQVRSDRRKKMGQFMIDKQKRRADRFVQ